MIIPTPELIFVYKIMWLKYGEQERQRNRRGNKKWKVKEKTKNKAKWIENSQQQCFFFNTFDVPITSIMEAIILTLLRLYYNLFFTPNLSLTSVNFRLVYIMMLNHWYRHIHCCFLNNTFKYIEILLIWGILYCISVYYCFNSYLFYHLS